MCCNLTSQCIWDFKRLINGTSMYLGSRCHFHFGGSSGQMYTSNPGLHFKICISVASFYCQMKMLYRGCIWYKGKELHIIRIRMVTKVVHIVATELPSWVLFESKIRFKYLYYNKIDCKRVFLLVVVWKF